MPTGGQVQCKRLVKRGAISQDAWLIYARRIPRTLTLSGLVQAILADVETGRMRNKREKTVLKA